jgi:hypothetical protein
MKKQTKNKPAKKNKKKKEKKLNASYLTIDGTQVPFILTEN